MHQEAAMSIPDPASNSAPPLKLLSLDGGGIRGLSSLIILKYLMKRVRPENPPKPCEFFDLIGGTNSGGLIAIMLGRFHMDVDSCINKYIELSSAAFQPKRSKVDVFGKARDLWKTDGIYRSECLANEFRKFAQVVEGSQHAKFIHPDTTCKVFVCAFTKALNTPVRLRSYVTEDSVDTLAGSACSIWEAARATSAAATFFDPIEVGRQKYVDGATGFNNPVEAVLEEAVSIWPDAIPRIQCLLSIGTGIPELRDFGDNLKDVITTLKAISTETEETEKRFFKIHKHLGIGDRYFRFNVDKGLERVGLDEHQKINKIEAATEAYLGDPRVKQAVEAFIAAHVPQNCITVAPALVQELLTAVHGSRHENTQLGQDIRTTVQKQSASQSSALSSLRAKFSTSFAASQNALQEQISSMHSTVETVSSISQGKMDVMLEMLQKISGRLGLEEIQTSFQQDDSSPYLETMRSIERLCGLVQEKERIIDTYKDDQADSIIDELRVILAAAQKQVETTWQTCDKHSSQESEKTYSMDIVRKIQRFNRQFGQDKLDINRGAHRRMFQHENFTQQESSYDRIDIGTGILAVRFNRRTRPSKKINNDDDPHIQNDAGDLTDYSMTVLFTPANPQRFHMLVASFLQEETYHDEMCRRSISSLSRLVVNKVLPESSKIFQLVTAGDLPAVQKMISDGEVSLREHDERGQSLLFYSMAQPEMCKFLVDKGLDVDHVAYDEFGFLIYPLQVENVEIGDENLPAVGQCYQILLEAGADPTIQIGKETDVSAFLVLAVFTCIPEYIRIAWNPEFVGHFADINQYKSYDQPIFLNYCENLEDGYSMDCFAALLQRGANINIRGACGMTCLHLCLLNSFNNIKYVPIIKTALREYEALKFLVESGADLMAMDFHGITVREYAYVVPGRKNRGSYTGDLWDCVLQSCGYDIKEFRWLYHRKAKYTSIYTREVFEALWKGREEFCPYWDDSPWPPREDGEVDSSDDDGAEEGDSSDGWSTVSDSSNSGISSD